MKRKFYIKISKGNLFIVILSIFMSGINVQSAAGSGLTDVAGIDQGTINVTGPVTSATDGSSLPGLSIVIKGTSQGTVTDSEGKYTINVPEEGTLVFSFIGFQTEELAVRGRNVINVT
ncbi:MAG: carboxypeptidase-like regulatory domain-containing protein, partial [Fermentimonas sp.]|nr:carboxypeptidase-like regulatory domain-containing protein [Fermentimonas sp.]